MRAVAADLWFLAAVFAEATCDCWRDLYRYLKET
jgi:hypothetical protein